MKKELIAIMMAAVTVGAVAAETTASAPNAGNETKTIAAKHECKGGKCAKMQDAKHECKDGKCKNGACKDRICAERKSMKHECKKCVKKENAAPAETK